MNPLLYGHNSEEQIVSISPTSDYHMNIFKRDGNQTIVEKADFFPFLFLNDSSLLLDYDRKYWLKKLEGNNYYHYLCATQKWSEFWDLIRHSMAVIANRTGRSIKAFHETDQFFLINDPVIQFMLQSGRTLFNGMEFSSLRRMQIDLIPLKNNYRKPFHQSIAAIAVSDSTGYKWSHRGTGDDDLEILKQLMEIIERQDPDIIEGFDLFSFVLPYLIQRCEYHRLDFNIGRDKSSPTIQQYSYAGGDRGMDTPIYSVHGRHFLDSHQLLHNYFSGKQEYFDYDLYDAALYFHIATTDDVYIREDKLMWCWENDRELLRLTIQNNVRYILAITNLLAESIFYQAQIVPASYNALSRMSATMKSELMLLREYIHQRYSIPVRVYHEKKETISKDLLLTGVFAPVIQCSIMNLLSTVIIDHQYKPSTDILAVFSESVESLTAMRKNEETASGNLNRAKLDAINILEHSFIAHISSARGLFRDDQIAEQLYEEGNNILKQIIVEVENQLGRVIEIDYDTAFIVPPPEKSDYESIGEFILHVNKTLPANIQLSIQDLHKKMLAIKKNNFAFLSYDDLITLHGIILQPRNSERFIKLFIRKIVEYLLQSDFQGFHDYYLNLHEAIASHKLPIQDFARFETLKDENLEIFQDSEEMKHHRSIIYELASSNPGKFQRGDIVAYYCTQRDITSTGIEKWKLAEEWLPNNPDEDIFYYKKKLIDAAAKFSFLFSQEDFKLLFSTDDLFGFAPEKITIRNHEKRSVFDDNQKPDPQIWLDDTV